MKTVVAFAVVTLALLVVCGTAQASATSWRLYIQTDSMNGEDFGLNAQIGVWPDSLDGVEYRDGSPIDFIETAPSTKWVVNEIAGNIYNKNYKANADYSAYPNRRKIWPLKVAGLTDSVGGIRLQFRTDTLEDKMPVPKTSDMTYYLKLVNDRGVTIGKPAWAGGGTWTPGSMIELSIPGTTNTLFDEIDLPLVKLSADSNAAMLSEGYEFQFIQGATPEPASFLALGAGLVGLFGIMRRKRTRDA